MPTVQPGASDSSALDNGFELLVRGHRNLPMVKTMMIPEASATNPNVPADHRAMYNYVNGVMEPWDGPAALAAASQRLLEAAAEEEGEEALDSPAEEQQHSSSFDSSSSSSSGSEQQPRRRLAAKEEEQAGKRKPPGKKGAQASDEPPAGSYAAALLQALDDEASRAAHTAAWRAKRAAMQRNVQTAQQVLRDTAAWAAAAAGADS